MAPPKRAKPTRKRWVLTNTRKASKEQQEISKQNVKKSLFLQLPAEIRNRIYEEALGHKTIHIATHDCPASEFGAVTYADYYRYKGWSLLKARKITHVVCRAKETECAVYHRSKSCNDQSGCRWNTITTYDERHKSCLDILGAFQKLWTPPENGRQRYIKYCKNERRKFEAMSEDQRKLQRYSSNYQDLNDLHRRDTLNLELLRVCRQIHREAALIPYETNTFAFTSGYDFDMFISRKLISQQRKAITTVQIAGYMEAYHEFLESVQLKNVLSLKNLTSLEITLTQGTGAISAGISRFYGLGMREEDVRVLVTAPQRKTKFSWKAFHRRECGDGCFAARKKRETIEERLRQDDGIKARDEKKKEEAKEIQKQKKRAKKEKLERTLKRKGDFDQASTKRRRVNDK